MRTKSMDKTIIRVYSKVIYFNQRITYSLVESKQNSTVIEGIKVT